MPFLLSVVTVAIVLDFLDREFRHGAVTGEIDSRQVHPGEQQFAPEIDKRNAIQVHQHSSRLRRECDGVPSPLELLDPRPHEFAFKLEYGSFGIHVNGYLQHLRSLWLPFEGFISGAPASISE